MKRLILAAALSFMISSPTSMVSAQVADTALGNLRPVRDNVGYCWDSIQMKRLINYLRSVDKTPAPPSRVIAAISPHDDYLYAARVYYPLYRVLRTKEVVIFGVTHGDVRPEIGDPHNIVILDSFQFWRGPRQNISISPLREFIKSKLDTSYCIVSNKAHALEHSIEALLPFIQYYNPDIKITPIMVTQMPFGRMDTISNQLSSIISEYIRQNHLVPGKDIAFLMSSDADHYGRDFNNIPYGEDAKAHKEATENDLRIAHNDLDGILSAGKVEDLTAEMKNTLWCGKYSVPFGLITTKKVIERLTGKSLDGKVLRYSDSYSEGVLPLKNTGMGTTAPASYKHWCGWLSAAYYLK
ncbi:MAG TPA: AmmeMemoRadiSam system protein B [Candidatus Acidoferrales bacterium]|nr:AmmeMemoRadiSam system protein B [Candidatus Acidoferrales bacterium]